MLVDDADGDSEQESADEVYYFPKYAFTVECGGATIKGKTDGDGYVRLRKMKRGKYFISIAD